MDTVSLDELTEQHLSKAREASSGRSAATLYGGRDHRLRHTIIAMTAGTELAEHASPGEATLHVLHGSGALIAGQRRWDLTAGDFVPIPDEMHSVDAVEDFVFILTVSKRLKL